ncbi:hypothetical protein BDQ12DRAFT_672337 [Crucibulum laeve]|uniref:Uncharacterized protein n=1 Tax=Crucibulum laeve TaxID=68775 RepID=A0A5C3MJK2_9AGAR|nr:hypothetical protein BDQ12DRAFT_672337 [Crucibulum laeve]
MQSNVYCLPDAYGTYLLRGHILAGIAYGIVLTLSIHCSQLLMNRVLSSNTRTRQAILLLAYVICVFVLCTLMIASNAHYVQRYSSGCGQIDLSTNASSAVGAIGGAFGDTCYVLTNWAVDGLLIWRCLVIYQGSWSRRWIFLISILMFVCSFAVGSLLIVVAFRNSPFDAEPLPLYQVLWIHSSVSMGINTVFTVAITGRLLVYRSRVTKLLGSKHGSHFISIVNMMIESASLVIMFLIPVVILCAQDTEVLVVPLQALSQIQAVASLWIIFRVAQGKAWTEDTSEELVSKSIAFRPEEPESGNSS